MDDEPVPGQITLLEAIAEKERAVAEPEPDSDESPTKSAPELWPSLSWLSRARY
jgi:hypothetical protein